jgi:hypothetical protein
MNVINGNYINFAICEYYNDDVFTSLTQLVMKMVIFIDSNELKQYAKVEGVVYNMLWSFFAKHLELIFMKLDSTLVSELLKILVSGLQNSPTFEI